ncbi:peptide chain release factor N(5)-glutamine methyltransferase [bacterium]|nr:peptide chain release factor N(5)-glutamine methyltransferase [bacterium]
MSDLSGPDARGTDGAGRTVTWGELLAETTAAVGDRAHARWLCEVASSSVDGDEFLGRMQEHATVRMVAHLDAMVARCRTGEPLQYVLGEWSFRHLTLAVDPRVLIPRPETEVVAGVAIELAAECGPTRIVADLGTGTGAIGLSMAFELPRQGTVVWLTDVSADAIDVARSNLAGIGPAAANVHVAHGSWFEALPSDTCFDVIVSNPPYVAVGSPDLEAGVGDWEPAGALFAGDDGLDAIRVLAAGAPDRLRPGGSIVLEIGADQGPRVSDLLVEVGLVEVEIRPDLSGRDRIAIARRPT